MIVLIFDTKTDLYYSGGGNWGERRDATEFATDQYARRTREGIIRRAIRLPSTCAMFSATTLKLVEDEPLPKVERVKAEVELIKGTDGVWLNVKTADGRQAGTNLCCISKGDVISKVFLDWAKAHFERSIA